MTEPDSVSCKLTQILSNMHRNSVKPFDDVFLLSDNRLPGLFMSHWTFPLINFVEHCTLEGDVLNKE